MLLLRKSTQDYLTRSFAKAGQLALIRDAGWCFGEVEKAKLVHGKGLMTPIIKSLLRFTCNLVQLCRAFPWLKGNQLDMHFKGNPCLQKKASATQGIEWLNQWRNMDTEAFALIRTGFDCHVQHRLIKKTHSSPENLWRQFGNVFRTKLFFKCFWRISIKMFLSVCDQDDKRLKPFRLPGSWGCPSFFTCCVQVPQVPIILEVEGFGSIASAGSAAAKSWLGAVSADCWNNEGSVKTVGTKHACRGMRRSNMENSWVDGTSKPQNLSMDHKVSDVCYVEWLAASTWSRMHLQHQLCHYTWSKEV